MPEFVLIIMFLHVKIACYQLFIFLSEKNGLKSSRILKVMNFIIVEDFFNFLNLFEFF